MVYILVLVAPFIAIALLLTQIHINTGGKHEEDAANFHL